MGTPGTVRSRLRRLLVVPVLLLCAVGLQVLVLDDSGAAFSASATRPPESFRADSLDPVTGLGASRACLDVTAPPFRSASTAAVEATSIEVARPAGVVAGDVLLAFVIHHDATNPPTLPTGWTQLRRGDTVGGSTLLAARVAVAAEPASYTFQGLDASDATAATVLAYRGASPTTPWEAHASLTTDATTVTAPALTALTAPTTWVTGFLVDDYTGSTTVPFPTTQRVSVLAPGPQEVTLAVGDRPLAATGSTGTQVAGLTQARGATGFSVLLRAAPAPADVTLSWTATSDGYATGYAVSRTGTATVTSVTPRTTTSVVDPGLPRDSGATYTVRSTAGSWRSGPAQVVVPAC